ncbi:MAG: FtsQ-type POTRA domain-containing protein [Ferruginibacter sp.]|nr:FtsQ-type POTRA domain-containing protein [Ferruginibacter sp.]
MTINKVNIIKFFIALVWVIVGAGCITLLVSAVHSKEAKYCSGVEINITGVSNTFFIDKTDVYNIIKNYGGDSTQRKSLASIDLKKIERALEKDVWIKNAELFFDNNNFLKVSVEEREPIARLFTLTGNTFYIDSSCTILPLSDKFSARLPVFTGFTSDAKILSKPDSALLFNIKNISIKILADSFLMAMIDQVDIVANRTFEMVPKLGKQRIIFGEATDADTKFSKLKLFYKDVITQAGWNRYSVINLQYKNQVVASIRGKEDIIADSLRTMQLIKFIAEDAARRSADSSQIFLPETDKRVADSSLIQQSIERDDEGTAPPELPLAPIASAPLVVKPTPVIVSKSVATKPTATVIPIVAAKPTVTKPEVTKPIKKPDTLPMVKNKKPAVVMPAKPAVTQKPKVNNDY